MENYSVLATILLFVTVLISYKGFKDHPFFEKYAFRVEGILGWREYVRLISSGFLHTGWWHLAFNMLSLMAFGGGLEREVGVLNFLLIYFVSLLGGSFLSLFVHRNHGDYSAVGASGAISGVIFACIALRPGMELSLLLLPFFIPAWAFAILFMLITIYGIRKQAGNIGHDAHLGGAVAGMLTACALKPIVLLINATPIFLTLVPSILFIIFIILKPEILLTDKISLSKKQKQAASFQTIEDKYHENKRNREAEVDRILEKIRQKGINSLTEKERMALDEHSKK